MKYKSICHKAEKLYRKYLTNQFINVGMADPNRFWSIINEMNNWGKERTDKTDNIKPDAWTIYFKNLLNEPKLNQGKTHHHLREFKKKGSGDLLWTDTSFDPILDGRITTEEMRPRGKNIKKPLDQMER